MMLTNLANICRRSGLDVNEVAGWQTRGHGPMSGVNTIVCHHTATSRSAPGDYPSMGIVRDGRSDLPGPLAQLGLGRSGAVYVIAAGVSYHAGTVAAAAHGNWYAIGIEAEADGISSPWPEQQMVAYARLCRALIDGYGLDVANVKGHKEVAVPLGRKIDPNFDMDAFRNRVRDATNQEDIVTPEDFDKIAKIVENKVKDQVAPLRREFGEFRTNEVQRDAEDEKRDAAIIDAIKADVPDGPNLTKEQVSKAAENAFRRFRRSRQEDTPPAA